MSGVKISALPAANGVGAADQLEVNQSGTTRRVTAGQLAALVQFTGGGEVSVGDFGAIGDGIADDTLAIQAAIDAAGVVRGGEVRFGSGTYLVTQTLDIPWPNVFLKGLGPDGLHSTPPHNGGAATILKWGGANGGTMIHIRSPAGAAVKKLYGGGVAGIGFHSGYLSLNTGADYGIRISSRDQGLYDNNFFYAFRRKAILLDCITDVLADARDTQNNVFTRQFSRNTYDNPEGGLFHLKGDESILYNTANISLNYFENCGAQFNAGIVYELGASDHNTFELCRANRIQHSYTVAGATVTISNGTPCIVTHTAHGMVNSGLQKSFTTTGALPDPLVVGTKYYVSVVDANTYRLCTTVANLVAGVFVNTTTDGSGTHTANPTGGDAIRFRGSNVASSLAAVDNTFRDYTGGDSIYAEGTTSCTYPSVDNIFENIDQTNYTPLVTKETGARCWLRTRTDGTTNDLMASGVVVGGAGLKSTVLSAFLHQIFSRVTNESLRISNRAANHLVLESPSADYTTVGDSWSAAIDGSGNFRFARLTGTGTITTTTGLLSSSASLGIGYATGAGGTVTQLVSKATAVSLSRMSGTIITAGLAAGTSSPLAAGTNVTFQWLNSTLVATDLVILNQEGNHSSLLGGTPGAYLFNARVVTGGAWITIRNVTAGSLDEVINIRFAVIKGVIA